MFDTAYAAAKADAVARFPQESCGIVVDGQYIALPNVAAEPEKGFAMEETLILPYLQNGSLQAMIHSHPFVILKERSSPSSSDMTHQMAYNVPWGIIDTDGTVVNDPYWWGDFILDEPLIGDEFHHGIRDCYTPIRKWFWQKRGIKLPDVPRDDQWWAGDKEFDLYAQGFERCGFIKITKGEMRDGDCMLGKVKSTKINHAGLYLDNPEDGHGLLLHHLYGRMCRREPAGPWLSRADLFLRYVGPENVK